MRRYFFICLSFLILSTFIAIRPASADYKQAVAYYSQGDFNRAIQSLKPDIDKSPDWEFGQRLMGLSYLNINNNALAVTHLSRAAELRSTAFSTYFGLGQAYFNMRRYNDAITALNRADQLAAGEENPSAERARVHIVRGTAHYRTNNFSGAVNDLREAVRSNPSDWTLFLMQGVSYLNLNSVNEAIQALERAIALQPGEAAIRDVLGRAYLRRGTRELSEKRYRDATQTLLMAKTYDSNNGYINYNLAEAYLFEQRYADAEKELTAAADRLPDNAGVFTRLGLVYERQNKHELALGAYRKAYELNPSQELRETVDRVSGNIRRK